MPFIRSQVVADTKIRKNTYCNGLRLSVLCPKFLTMKKLLALLAVAGAPFVALSAVIKMDLDKAIKSHDIKMEAINYEGRYVGKTTRLMLTNNNNSPIQVKVNVGMILRPDDTTYQPMVLAGEELLVVAPHQTGQVEVMTFCGNSPRSCPAEGLHYAFSRIGDDTLVKVLKYLKTNGLLDHLGQSAVWVVTNGHSPRGVYDVNRDAESKKLVDFLCAATGRNTPDYYTVTQINETPSQPAYVPKPLMIVAKFEIMLDAPKTMTLGVYDDRGNLIQKVFENQEFGKTGHRFRVEFESADVPAGKYYIRLKEYDQVLQEKMVQVD